jgi:hypothetical protein
MVEQPLLDDVSKLTYGYRLPYLSFYDPIDLTIFVYNMRLAPMSYTTSHIELLPVCPLCKAYPLIQNDVVELNLLSSIETCAGNKSQQKEYDIKYGKYRKRV